MGGNLLADSHLLLDRQIHHFDLELLLKHEFFSSLIQDICNSSGGYWDYCKAREMTVRGGLDAVNRAE